MCKAAGLGEGKRRRTVERSVKGGGAFEEDEHWHSAPDHHHLILCCGLVTMGKRSRSYSESDSDDGDSRASRCPSSSSSSEEDDRKSSTRRRSKGGEDRDRERSSRSKKSSRRDKDKDKGKGKGRGKEKAPRYTLRDEDKIDVKQHYLSKNREYRRWLIAPERKKPRPFMTLDSSEQKRLFKKFAKQWNKGKLDRSFYEADGPVHLGGCGAEDDEPGPRLQLGPALPPPSPPAPGARNGAPSLDDLAMQRDAELDARAARKDAERGEYKRAQKEGRQEERENRATGRDRIQEKRMEQRESGRAMAAAKEQGDMEFSETYLMGGASSSFQDAVRRRDNSKAHRERERKVAERQAAVNEKVTEMKKRDNDTMAMVGVCSWLRRAQRLCSDSTV